MKLFPNLLASAAETLELVMTDGQQADATVSTLLASNPKWGSRDRNFLASSVYGTVRYWSLYEACLEKIGLEMSNERMILVWWLHEGHELPPYATVQIPSPELVLPAITELQKSPKIRESYPDWLWQLGQEELGENWEAAASAMNQTAQLCIRANRIKANRPKLIAALAEEGITAVAYGPDDALIVPEKKKITSSKAFEEGLFEVQDHSSQLVAHLLAPEPGMMVVDTCAGAGGKSLHLAALCRGKGEVLSLDIDPKKLQNLRARAQRAGAFNIQTRTWSNSFVPSVLKDKADRLLLDVPCSGSGTFRHKPDAKWKLTPDFFTYIQSVQQDLLHKYSGICKVGGRMVYATCSIMPDENEKQIAHFLETTKQQWELISQKTVLPQEEGFDGFFMALLERKA
jgi:16S rRNA (cytosine967-C5)-methyltransferase